MDQEIVTLSLMLVELLLQESTVDQAALWLEEEHLMVQAAEQVTNLED